MTDEIKNIIQREREEIIELIRQMRGIHEGSPSVKSTLEFLEDCIKNRK